MKRLSVVLLTAVMATSSLVQAESTEESRRLEQLLPKAERYSVKTPVSSVEAGSARTVVKSSLQDARFTITDFANYSKMISTFEEARIVGKTGDQTDVYLRVPILKGAAKVWAVMRFNPPKKVSDDELVMTASMVKGNVRQFEATYRLKKIDDKKTQLNLEMLLVPYIPAPGYLITREVSDASDEAVCHFRAYAEKRAKK